MEPKDYFNFETYFFQQIQQSRKRRSGSQRTRHNLKKTWRKTSQNDSETSQNDEERLKNDEELSRCERNEIKIVKCINGWQKLDWMCSCYLKNIYKFVSDCAKNRHYKSIYWYYIVEYMDKYNNETSLVVFLFVNILVKFKKSNFNRF